MRVVNVDYKCRVRRKHDGKELNGTVTRLLLDGDTNTCVAEVRLENDTVVEIPVAVVAPAGGEKEGSG